MCAIAMLLLRKGLCNVIVIINYLSQLVKVLSVNHYLIIIIINLNFSCV